MESFLYDIREIKKRKRKLSIEDILEYYDKMDAHIIEDDDNQDESSIYYVDLDEESLLKEYNSYTVKELVEILKYYDLPRKKARKSLIIRKIIKYELNQENAAMVQLRYGDT